MNLLLFFFLWSYDNVEYGLKFLDHSEIIRYNELKKLKIIRVITKIRITQMATEVVITRITIEVIITRITIEM